MTRILLVSFVTQPGEGSEGGVGWNFLNAAAHVAAKNKVQLDVIIDSRDTNVVERAAKEAAWAADVTIHSVTLPHVSQNRFGNSRSRASYLTWAPYAAATANRLARQLPIDVCHQVTFATASLPPILPRTATKKVWGPLAVPGHPITNVAGVASSRERMLTYLSRIAGRQFLRRTDVTLSQNDFTQALMQSIGVQSVLEPNIVFEARVPETHIPGQLAFSGNLINRKRPWICLQALKHPRLRDYRLDFVGDGPLRPQLMSYVRQERMDARVAFRGRMPRAEALAIVSRVQALLLPSTREGAPWVVGEAASLGVPSVVSSISGAGTVVRLSGDLGSEIEEGTTPQETASMFAEGITSTAHGRAETQATTRWSGERLPAFLQNLWGL